MTFKRTNKIIVLDVDETLVHTGDDDRIKKLNIFSNIEHIRLRPRIFKFPLYGYKNEKDYSGIMRPNLDKFLNWCHEYFRLVILWSAGEDTYVKKIVECLYKNGYPKFDYIFTREFCDIKNMCKPLSKIYEQIPAANDKNTIIIDDLKRNFMFNERNGLLIPAYDPKETIEDFKRDDDTFIKIMDWFETKEVIESKDVKSLKFPDLF